MAQYIVKFNQQSADLAAVFSWHLLWLTGVLIVVTVALYSQWKIATLPRTPFTKTLLQSQSSLPAALKVAESAYFNSPVLTGLIRPVLLLPQGFQQQFSPEQQQLIIEHELVHLRRYDNLFNAIALLFVALCWFNPLIWLAYAEFRRSQELACDACVLKNKDKSQKVAYSKALLLCAQHPSLHLSLYSQYGEKHSMHLRIQSIKNPKSLTPKALAVVLVISTSLLSGVVLANQQDKSVQFDKVNEATPIMRVEPKYPLEAAEQKTEGSVVLQFDIGKDGSTNNIKVIKGEPQLTFDKVAVTAIQQWKYKPRIVGGMPQVQPDMLVQLDFRMDESNTQTKPLIEGITVHQ